MKNVFFIPLSLLVFIFLSACDNTDNNATPNEVITTEEAYTIVEEGIISDGEGLSQEVLNTVLVLTEELSCNASFDSTLTRNYTGDLRTANYTLDWQWSINCNQFNIPTDVSFGSATQGDYDGPRLTTNSSATGTYAVTGLEFSSPAYLINGTYNREGSQALKVGEMRSFSSAVAYTIADISINKATFTIESGSGTFALSGTNKNGDTFLIDGSIVFNGNQSATITINGEAYEVNW